MGVRRVVRIEPPYILNLLLATILTVLFLRHSFKEALPHACVSWFTFTAPNPEFFPAGPSNTFSISSVWSLENRGSVLHPCC